MSFDEFLVVVISVIISVPVNCIIWLLQKRREEEKTIKRAEGNLRLFAEELRIAILNDSKTSISFMYGLLLPDFYLICERDNLRESFFALWEIYHYFVNGAYENDEEKRERDVQSINKLVKERV